MATKLDAIRSLYLALERAGMGGEFRFRMIEEMADTLRIAGNALRRIGEARCNGIAEEDQAKAVKAIARHEAKALTVLHQLPSSMLGGWRMSFNYDPRGSAIRLFTPGDDPETGNAAAYF